MLRFKIVTDNNRATGRSRITQELYKAIRPILDHDPSIHPSCIISAGTGVSVETEGNIEAASDTGKPTAVASATTGRPRPAAPSTGRRRPAPSASTDQLRAAAPSTSTGQPRAAASRKRNNQDLITCIEQFTEESKNYKRKIADGLKSLVAEEKRKNDLFEQYPNILTKE